MGRLGGEITSVKLGPEPSFPPFVKGGLGGDFGDEQIPLAPFSKGGTRGSRLLNHPLQKSHLLKLKPMGGEMRLPSKSNRTEASSRLSPRRSHGVLIRAGAFMVSCGAIRHGSSHESGSFLREMPRIYDGEAWRGDVSPLQIQPQRGVFVPISEAKPRSADRSRALS